MSYERDARAKIDANEDFPQKITIPILKYFWQANPLFANKSESIPRFLRNVTVLSNFTENELRILSGFLHQRSFSNGEHVFRQEELGMGFYFIYSGHVDIIVETKEKYNKENAIKHIVSLDKHDYFGELALLQSKSIRNATAMAQDSCELLGLFKPDMELLTERHPIVATKLLQSISIIISNRLFSLTKEVVRLKSKILELERKGDKA